nr:MAG TPA: hypothetical protein [Bacteriophage sp.]
MLILCLTFIVQIYNIIFKSPNIFAFIFLA